MCILGRTVLDLGADPKILTQRLGETAAKAEAAGNAHGAAALGFLTSALFPSSNPEPEPSAKPSLRIV